MENSIPVFFTIVIFIVLSAIASRYAFETFATASDFLKYKQRRRLTVVSISIGLIMAISVLILFVLSFTYQVRRFPNVPEAFLIYGSCVITFSFFCATCQVFSFRRPPHDPLSNLKTAAASRKRALVIIAGLVVTTVVVWFLAPRNKPKPNGQLFKLVIGTAMPRSARIVESEESGFPFDDHYWIRFRISSDDLRAILRSGTFTETYSADAVSVLSPPPWWCPPPFRASCTVYDGSNFIGSTHTWISRTLCVGQSKDEAYAYYTDDD